MFIGLSMRVEKMKDLKERRDSIDQRWFDFLQECSLMPILLPNNINCTKEILKHVQISGIILTGGNDLSVVGGDAPERDHLENLLINHCVDHAIPLMGVCRGMQMLLSYFEEKIFPVEVHVGTQHVIEFSDHNRIVNSYHQYGATALENDNFNILARASDKVIEAIEHVIYPIKGIMWHPERNSTFEQDDIHFFVNHFSKEIRQ